LPCQDCILGRADIQVQSRVRDKGNDESPAEPRLIRPDALIHGLRGRPSEHGREEEEPLNFGEKVLQWSNSASSARNRMSSLLASADPIVGGVCGFTGGPISWHYRLDEVCSSLAYDYVMSRRDKLRHRNTRSMRFRCSDGS
jgi:hypothetical protein